MNWRGRLLNTVKRKGLLNCLGVLLVPFAALGLASQSATAIPLTFAWNARQDWPSGTTIELEANGVTADGITATQHTFDVPVQPGEVISARVRAIPPTGYQCGDPLGPCEPSDWDTLAQTLPAVPTGVWGHIEPSGSDPMALSATPDFWWKLQETSGTAVDNAGGYGTPSSYDGTVTRSGSLGETYSWNGSGEAWGSGGITGGIDFDTPIDTDLYYIQLGSVVPLAAATKITIAYWYEREEGNTYDSRVFMNGNSYFEAGHQFMVGATGGATARARINGSTYVGAATDYPDETKVHMVWVLDFGLSGNELKLYKNGNTTPIHQWDVTGTAINADSGYSGISSLIGASPAVTPTGRGNPINGKLADVRIWLDAATASEAQAIYDNSLGGGAATISPNNMQHAQSMDAATLLQAHILSVAELLHSQALDNATITQAFTLTPSDAINTQAIDATTLLQQSVISPADLLQGNTLDATTLIQAHTLAIADITHAQTIDNLALVVSGDITPDEMMTAQAIDEPLLLQAHIISPNDALNAQSIDSPVIVQSNVLIPAGMDHAVILDSPVIVQANVISPSELLTAQAVDNVTLAVLGSLSVDDLLSSQAIESPGLTQAHTIAPNELTHVNSIDASELFQGFILVPADLLHEQEMEGALLDVIFGLSPADLLNAQGIESPGLIQAHVIFPADLLQANRFDVAGISSGLLQVPTGRAIVLGASDRYVLLTPADRFILLTKSTRVVS
jgi:hypothetical protein